jgi:hypothetical protein
MDGPDFKAIIEHIHECLDRIGNKVDAHLTADQTEHAALHTKVDRLAAAVTAHAADTTYVRQQGEDLNSKMGAVDAKFDSSIARQLEIFNKLHAVHSLLINGHK